MGLSFPQFITCFIIVYIFWWLGRWFVLPHLRIFPYIRPLWLWTTLYAIFAYIMNWIFLWIILYLIICYISWVVIREIIPDFPIPLKSILLDMAPWKPLTDAGILQFIDGLVRIFVSGDTIKVRAWRAGVSTAQFLTKSYKYLQKTLGYKLGNGSKPDPNATMRQDNKQPPLPPNAVRRSTKPSLFEQDESQQVKDEYLQCIEQRMLPIYKNMGMETAQAITKNQTATVMCKLNMLQSYSYLTYNRAS